MQPYRFQDSRQKRLYRKLQGIGPGPAAFYRDICIILDLDTPLESVTHSVAHLLREIEDAICDVLEPMEDREKRLNSSTEEERSHRIEIENILKSLEISDDDIIAKSWKQLVLKPALHKRAHRDSLGPPRKLDQEFEEFYDNMETLLHAILDKSESAYLIHFELLDELLLKSCPTKVDITRLKKNIPNNPIVMGYFFDKLESPDWLELLAKKGFFSRPPQPEIDIDTGGIQFPGWAQSRYLAKMAKIKPEMILDIILQIPDVGNVRIYRDFIDAAVEMPPKLSVKMVPKVIIGVEAPVTLLLSEKFANLVTHLATGGMIKDAIDLTREVFKILPEERAYFENWYYDEAINKCLPGIVKADGIETLKLFCDLLEDAIRSYKKENGPEDHSYIWRRSLESYNYGGAHGLKDILVSVVRIVAEELITKGMGDETLEIIEKRSFKVFKRIGLYLRNKWIDSDSEGTGKLIIESEIFHDPHYDHELYQLLSQHFNILPESAQKAYLDLIAEGIDIDEVEDDVREERLKYWQYTKLLPIQTYLDGEWQVLFATLQEKFEGSDGPDYPPGVSEVMVGPTSPMEVEELQLKTVKELVSFLNTWQPPKGFMCASQEGLGRTLSTLVATEPEKYVSEVELFYGLDPTYIRGMLSGFREAVKQNHPFIWAPVLELCCWVMNQPRDIPDRKEGFPDADPNWGWSRKTIAELLSVGLTSETVGIPIDFRSKVWDVLEPLTDDPDPTPEYETKYGGSNMDPANLSINSTRGEAMHAVVRYAYWIRNHNEQATDEEPGLPSFDEAPEARTVLEHHLDPSNDPSLAVRAVYGQRFPYFEYLDTNWAREYVDIIFPADEQLRELYNASWGTYIMYNRPNKSLFDLLQNKYDYAITRLVSVSSEVKESLPHEKSLADHLMILYCWNRIDFSDDGLLNKFYGVASDDLCHHALRFLGQALKDKGPELSPEIIDRMKALWSKRFENAKNSTAPSLHSSELSAFGLWFTSEILDDKWKMKQLKEILEIVNIGISKHQVVEELSKLAPEMPLETVECLDLIIESDEEGWSILGWRDEARIILETSYDSAEVEAKRISKKVISRLAFQGHLEFRDILS